MSRARALSFSAAAWVTALTFHAGANEPDEPNEVIVAPAPPPALVPAEPVIIPPPSIPTPAWPACGEDVLVRRDGGMLRGVILELLPRERIVMKVATGEIVSVPWPDVHHVQQGGPVARSCTPSEVPAASPVDDGGVATLAIEEPGYTLEGQFGTSWQVVCRTPCEVAVPRSRFHRITGGGIQTSPGFRVNGQPGERVVVHVSPGHHWVLGLGVTLLTVGVVATYVGYTALPAQALDDDTKWPLPTFLLGLGATLGGGVLVQSNLKTTVSQQPVVMPERERERRGVEPPRPTAFMVPILAGRF